MVLQDSTVDGKSLFDGNAPRLKIPAFDGAKTALLADFLNMMNQENAGTHTAVAGSEAAFPWLNEMRTWGDSILSEEALRDFAADWPKAKEMVLQETIAQLEDPAGPLSESLLPMAGFHFAAAFRDSDFIEPLLDWIFMEPEIRENMCGDILINAAPSLLALMASRSPESIVQLEFAATELPGTDALHQLLVLHALTLLLRDGLYERERFNKVVETLAEQIDFDHRSISVEPWCDWLALALTYAGVGDFEYEIRRWHRKGMMSETTPRIFDIQEFEKHLSEHPEGRPDEFFLKLYREMPEDPSKCMEWVRDMQKTHERYKAERDDEEEGEFLSRAPLWNDGPTMPLLRVEPKIGRNDPCPCGSRKKYKKCCGAS